MLLLLYNLIGISRVTLFRFHFWTNNHKNTCITSASVFKTLISSSYVLNNMFGYCMNREYNNTCAILPIYLYIYTHTVYSIYAYTVYHTVLCVFMYPASVLQAMAVLVCAEMYQVKRLQHLCEVCVCAYLQSMPSRELASTGISVIRLLRRAKVSAILRK